MIDELVQASAPAVREQAKQAALVTAAPQVAAEVLSDLITPATAEPSSIATPSDAKQSSSRTPAASQADFNVLDELMGGSNESRKKES